MLNGKHLGRSEQYTMMSCCYGGGSTVHVWCVWCFLQSCVQYLAGMFPPEQLMFNVGQTVGLLKQVVTDGLDEELL